MMQDLTVLVADDMEGMRRILTNSLQQMGVRQVLTASHGAEAWRMLQLQRVDVLITDWAMPQMDGLALLQAVRARPELAHLPVLMMTAESEKHRVQQAIAAGVSGYMVKPFTVGALEAKIRRAVAQPHPSPDSLNRPVPVVARRPAPTRTLPRADESQPVVLAVDDVPDNLDILVEVLGEDHQVKVASSGARALKILASGKLPDLILLDIMMPEMDGYEVCRRIKADPSTRDIPVIFLTAMNETVDVTRGFEVGAVDFVNKPAEPAILRARMATHLRLRRTVVDLERHRRALIEQNAVLEDNARLRDEFERLGQHDLKNPVAGIVNFAGSLLADPTLGQTHKDIVQYIEHSAYRVLDMVNRSLDLYKMELGTYVYEGSTLDLSQALGRVLAEVASEMATQGLQLVLQHQGQTVAQLPPVWAIGDDTLLHALLGNLLRNALDAAAPQTPLVLALDTEGPWARLALTNDGVVPPQIRERFFDKFATAGKAHGHGLGTFSARLMARTQSGELLMSTSDSTHTTTLTLSLPRPVAAQA